MLWRLSLCVGLAAACSAGRAQVIEFESGGLKYQTLTHKGVTVMFAHMPAPVRGYAIVQVAVSNGSQTTCAVQPESFIYQRNDGTAVQAVPARNVIVTLIEKGSRNDVIQLVTAYEAGLYGMSRIRSTNGYEQRRQAALAEVSSTRLKAAAAASAIAFVATKLTPGQSTDGAVFFHSDGRPLAGGRLVTRIAGAVFEFNFETPREVSHP
jgi:hypothetical protein